MADNISNVGGVDNACYANTPAWHKKGTVLNGNFSGAEALAASHTGYEVATDDIYTSDMKKIPGFKATLRTDNRTVFGVVSDKYKVIQNKELVEYADAICGVSKSYYDAAFALGGGEIVCYVLKLPEDMLIGQMQDRIEKYLVLTNTHDGTRAMRAFMNGQRVECQNMLNAALNAKVGEGVYIRHIGEIKEKVEESKRILMIANQNFEKFAESMNYLISKPMFPEMDPFFDAVFPLPKDEEISQKAALKARLFVMNGINGAGRGLDHSEIRGTRYACFNSVCEFFDHEKKFRTEDNKMKNLFFGTSVSTKTKALELLMAD